ncbi:MAG: HEAT repeat domain-containing protein [Planctomycetes bacterium]|nr:HEAT repeat domain-containing protein [Planctomycetota bacterium]
MKSRLVGGVAAVVIVAVAALWLEPDQTVLGKLAGDAFFQGRPTRSWMRSLRGGPSDQAAAKETLQNGGPAAVPVLGAMLVQAREPEIRFTAADLLAKLGSDASPAGAALLAGAQDADPHVQAVCVAALPKAGVPSSQAVPVLMAHLKTDHLVVAARALAGYREAAAGAIPMLLEIFRDKNQPTESRWNAVRTLGKIGPASAVAIPDLIQGFDDAEWSIREHCAESLGEIGPAAAPSALPGMVRLLSDAVPRVRRDAVRSLGQIGGAAVEAVPEIRKLLEDPEEIVRVAAQNALEKLAPPESSDQPGADKQPAENRPSESGPKNKAGEN